MDDIQIVLVQILKNRLNSIERKTDCELYETVRGKIYPLIKYTHKDLFDFAKNQRLRYTSAEEKLLFDTKNTYELIKNRLIKESFLDNLHIKKIICGIDSILRLQYEDDRATEIVVSKSERRYICENCGDNKESHRAYVFPTYARGLFHEAAYLIRQVFLLGREDLIKEFIEIREFNHYQEIPSVLQKFHCVHCKYIYSNNALDENNSGDNILFDELDEMWECPQCRNPKTDFLPSMNNVKMCKVREIERFIFTPSIYILSYLENIFYCDDNVPLWAAFEIFDYIEMMDAEDVRNALRKTKKLSYKSHKHFIKNRNLLLIDSAKEELKAICKRPESRQINLFRRNYLVKALNAIDNALEHSNKIYPYAIELLLDEWCLYLMIEWHKDCIEVLYIQKFREKIDEQSGEDAENKVYNFVEYLLENPGMHTSLNYLLGTKVNAKKYLNKIGIKDILYDLFINNESGSLVSLESSRIILKNIDESKLEKLCKIFDDFKTEKWIINGIDYPI